MKKNKPIPKKHQVATRAQLWRAHRSIAIWNTVIGAVLAFALIPCAVILVYLLLHADAREDNKMALFLAYGAIIFSLVSVLFTILVAGDHHRGRAADIAFEATAEDKDPEGTSGADVVPPIGVRTRIRSWAYWAHIVSPSNVEIDVEWEQAIAKDDREHFGDLCRTRCIWMLLISFGIFVAACVVIFRQDFVEGVIVLMAAYAVGVAALKPSELAQTELTRSERERRRSTEAHDAK